MTLILLFSAKTYLQPFVREVMFGECVLKHVTLLASYSTVWLCVLPSSQFWHAEHTHMQKNTPSCIWSRTSSHRNTLTYWPGFPVDLVWYGTCVTSQFLCRESYETMNLMEFVKLELSGYFSKYTNQCCLHCFPVCLFYHMTLALTLVYLAFGRCQKTESILRVYYHAEWFPFPGW